MSVWQHSPDTGEAQGFAELTALQIFTYWVICESSESERFLESERWMPYFPISSPRCGAGGAERLLVEASEQAVFPPASSRVR